MWKDPTREYRLYESRQICRRLAPRSRYPSNGGNVVLSGHNNIGGEVFRYLMALELGDEIDLYVDHTVYPGAVVREVLRDKKGMPIEVRRQDVQWIAPANYERLMLVTRGTYSTYTHRSTVIALKGTHPSELYGLV